MALAASSHLAYEALCFVSLLFPWPVWPWWGGGGQKRLFFFRRSPNPLSADLYGYHNCLRHGRRKKKKKKAVISYGWFNIETSVHTDNKRKWCLPCRKNGVSLEIRAISYLKGNSRYLINKHYLNSTSYLYPSYKVAQSHWTRGAKFWISCVKRIFLHSVCIKFVSNLKCNHSQSYLSTV